jgi:hypothetical protein
MSVPLTPGAAVRALRGGAWLLAACAIAWPAEARADSDNVVLELEGAASERPAAVCVVHDKPSQPKGKPAQPDATIAIAITDPDGDGRCRRAADNEQTFRVAEQCVTVRGLLEEKRGKAVVAALGKLEARSQPGPVKTEACGLRSGACRPQLKLPAGGPYLIDCADTPVPLTDRVALMILSFPADYPRPLEQVLLEGNTATVQLAELTGLKTQPVATLRLIGGDYEVDDGHEVQSFLRLRLTARCVLRDLVVPDAIVDPLTHFSIWLQGPTGTGTGTCTAPVARTLQLALPRTEGGREVRGRVEVLPGKKDETRESFSGSEAEPATVANESLVFGFQYLEREPPARLHSKIERMHFSWHAGCEYSLKADCPKAMLVDVGVGSDGTGTTVDGVLTCQYAFPRVEQGFELPARVQFTSPDGNDTWSASLARAGQTLSGYVDRDRRRFDVEFPWASPERMEATADRIDQVRLTTQSGRLFVFRPKAGSRYRIEVPGASCGDELEYRIVGDREYDTDTIALDKGVLEVPDPSCIARQWYVSTFVGGGPRLTLTTDDAAADPFGSVGLVVRWDPAGLLLLEGEYTYSLGRRRYAPIHSEGNDDPNDEEAVLYQRHELGLAGGLQLFDAFAFGLALGVSMSSGPILLDDNAKVGEPQTVFSPYAFVVWRLGTVVSLATRVRFYVNDEVYEFRFSPLGNPSVAERSTLGVAIEIVQLRVQLATL